jgi:O-antigen/teichoic acid export membrane protein
MAISLFTGRVILQIVGVDNFGIYNVVGGVLGLFSIISASLINAISRYLTVYLGQGDLAQLKKVFSTSLLIQCILSILLVFVAETLGLWFLNSQLNIDPERLTAANWVFQLSIVGTILGLMVVPYNASIISHEKMGAYAYLSIIEVVIKLLLIYAIWIIPGDKLLLYALMMFVMPVIMQVINVWYCKKHFEECSFDLKIDKKILLEMGKFSGWNFFGNASNVCCSQGISMILNIFFGVSVNAARGVVSQVEQAVRRFADNFMTAVNPQLTKSYALNHVDSVKRLMDMSSRMSFFLYMFISLPIGIAAKEILDLWLVEVPAYSVIFLRFTMIQVAINIIGNSSYTVIMATGNIKTYQLYVAISGFLVLPITWLMYHLGAPAYVCYICLIVHSLYVVGMRMYLLQKQMGIPLISWYLSTTVVPIVKVLGLAGIIPLVIYFTWSPSLSHTFVVALSAVLSSVIAIYFLGLNKTEKAYVQTMYKTKQFAFWRDWE